MDQDDARRLVRATLTELGLDVTSPERVIQAQHDFAYLRHQRNLSEKIGVGVRLMVLTSIISAGLATIWLGIRHSLLLK
ncbi:hypothetical protein [Nisaea sp.]|jgi:hypothetical protein|uniref:hypothetical protein n=1 Tax=Nisaea sp. TaxID=2024842 RepID=UPI002B26CC42|nr:hypothetical protein [Nisaea sp.]